MLRRAFLLLIALAHFSPAILAAFDDDGPSISITSPDNGTTFPHAQIKSHTLLWYPKRSMLVACITFTDAQLNVGQPNDDTHFFDLPGVTLDPATGIFTAKSIKGEVIPVARYKKTLFIKSIQVLPNANVRVVYPQGQITVKLLAVSPNDPALRKPAAKESNDNPDGLHEVDLKSLLN